MNATKKLKESTDHIFELAQKAEPFSYKGLNGEDITEMPGSYHPGITTAMSYEIEKLSLLLLDTEWGKKLSHAGDVMSEKDFTICRMIEAHRDGRKLPEYSFEDTEKEVKVLEGLYESGLLDEKPYAPFKPKFREWCRRFVKMDVTAHYFMSHAYIKEFIEFASARAYDSRGNQVYGISEKDESCVRIMTKMEEVLLYALVRLPECSDEMTECMDKIEKIELLIYLTTSGNSDKIEYLAKCMEAAIEFKDAEKQ